MPGGWEGSTQQQSLTGKARQAAYGGAGRVAGGWSRQRGQPLQGGSEGLVWGYYQPKVGRPAYRGAGIPAQILIKSVASHWMGFK